MSGPGQSDAGQSGPGQRRQRLFLELWQVLRPHQGLIWLSLTLLLLNAACRLAQPFLVKVAVDAHLVPRTLDGFWWVAGGYLGVAAAEAALRRWQLVALEIAGQNALLDLRRRVFAHLQRLPAAFYDRTPLGRLVGRVTTDVEALQELFSSGVVTILGDVLFLAAAVIVMLSLSVELTLVTLLVVPLLVLTTMLVQHRSKLAYRAMREKISHLNGFLHEHVSGMPVVQMFGQEDARKDEFDAINGGVRDTQLRTVHWESVLSAATELFGAFTIAVILWYGASLAADPEQMVTLGTLVAFVEYMRRFFGPLNELSLKFTVMQNALVAGERIFALLDESPEDGGGAATPAPPPPGRRKKTGTAGAIEFRHVCFAYSPDKPVLQDLSFTVRPGERLAIVGPTGAGKSTILSLLTRLYEIDSGEILLDGVDIRQLDRGDLRRQIGVVQQDVFLFQGTILQNIRLGQPGASDADAVRAAKELHFDEVVARFPRGYHEPVAEHGRNLSAGEKQLIAFARMLVVAPPVLALDEATSNVDSHTEHLLQQAVRRVMAGRTSLVIAHRLSTIQDADRILRVRAASPTGIA